ncbi:MAG: arylsulfatase [Phycisphaeraceae bacterium]|nr:arylsulfatase [Phycisphaeraceae bacterium]
MHRNRSFLVITLLGMLLSGVTQRADAADNRPNIVLIMCDDMGFSDIGCYGGEVQTPNLDKLTEQGVRFRTFYNNAKCEHTRASLITGQWWHHVGASASVTYKGKTFGDRMREAGYRTLMAGKWHAGQTPYQRGFDRYFGLTDGCCNFWNPGKARPGEPEPAKKRVRRWANDGQEYKPFTPEDKDFYTTDVFTDYALGYLDEYKDEDKPFFLYLAYTAPHYPLHASKEDVRKYAGKYKKIGWDKLREQRFARQIKLGVHTPNTALPPRDTGVPAWKDIKQADRDWWDLRMATYAAMIDRMDRNIGRLLDKLETHGDLDNTVIFFLSDNGAEADSKDRSSVKGSMPWEVTSYLTQGKPWANASNTPFRKYKTTPYEGGTRTPMIACWPGKTPAGTWSDHVGHLIDLTPTFLDLASADTPADLPGQSLVQAIKGESTQEPRTLYWRFGGDAIRVGDWKGVRTGKTGQWQLYNLTNDPTEQNNLAGKHPDRVEALAKQWQAWWGDKGSVQ